MNAKAAAFWMLMAAAIVGLWWGTQQESRHRTPEIVGTVVLVLVARALMKRLMSKRGSHKDPA
jgi:quinol-cytochrome oxidoreductase complex cytochrome b subunit